MTILSCDPGLSGAFFTFDGVSADVRDMPTFKRQVGGKSRTVIDEAGIRETFEYSLLMGCDRLIIEKVQGVRGQSASASFNFGYGFGVVLTTARLSGFRVDMVEPATWKQAMKAPKEKGASRQRATDLMPQFAHLWPQAGHDGRAEAAMLWLYAQQYVPAWSDETGKPLK